MKRAFSPTLRTLLFALLLASTGSLTSHISAHATDSAPARRLQVAPLRTEVEIKPGAAYTGIAKFKNTGTEPLDVQLSAEVFTVQDETYDYTFLPNSTRNSWVHFATQSFTLQPSEIRPMQYVVNIPVDAEPGGLYFSIFGASQPSDQSSINSTDRVGSLLYITVGGNITKTGSLLNFSTPAVGTGAAPWSATVHNTGSAHFRSDYTVELKTLWGTAVARSEGNSLVLPGTIRKIDGSLDSPQWLGLYIAHYSIPLGDNGTATGTRPFLYLPIGQTTALVALIASVVILIRTGIQRRNHKQKDDALSSKNKQK